MRWWYSQTPLLVRLKGHNGIIFGAAHQSAVGMFWVSSLHTASGTDVSLEPPVASDQVLEDLRRRCAYAVQVGIRQVTLVSGSQELLGNCLVADVINEATAQDLTVVLQPVLRVSSTAACGMEVYRFCEAEACGVSAFQRN
eukprot:Skav223641  [mRNA]  locus=scaffold46:564814:565236:- [translate_table: standard]